MQIITKYQGLQSELAEEVRQFEGTEKALVRHEIEMRDGICCHSVTVTLGEREAVARCTGARGTEEAWERKRLDKRAAKNACYQALCTLFGQTQPWGSLTGVRPTALLRALIKRGQGRSFTDYYGVDPRKHALAQRIVDVQDDLMQKVDSNSICLYIGIPFCVSRCSYCSFPGRIAKKGEMEAYMEALMLEMDAAAQTVESHKSPVAAIYIGGGTPTSLPLPLLQKLLGHMQACFGTAKEVTLEAGRPDTLDTDKLLAAKRAGVTRLCINPQSMVDETLVRIGRSHTAKDVEEAVKLARETGFSHINMDIIAGLPGETVDDFAHTLSRIRCLAPSALTCHTLSLKRGSRLLFEQHVLCDAPAVSRMVENARTCAQELDMEPYYMYRQKYMAGNLENVGYAKNGKACLYNIAMMDEMLPVMALGVGSVSKVFKGDLIVRKPNPRDLFVYLERLESIVAQKRDFYSVDKKMAAVYNIENGNEEDK